jgi:hypothetical protein
LSKPFACPELIILCAWQSCDRFPWEDDIHRPTWMGYQSWAPELVSKQSLIVRKLDKSPTMFSCSYCLFQLENELIELLLQRLVRVVDTELLKRVM